MQKGFQHLLYVRELFFFHIETVLHLACSMELGIGDVCAKCVTYHVIKPSSCV